MSEGLTRLPVTYIIDALTKSPKTLCAVGVPGERVRAVATIAGHVEKQAELDKAFASAEKAFAAYTRGKKA